MAELVSKYIDSKRKAVENYLEAWQSTAYSTIVLGATLVLIFWASIFLYTSFYFSFIPQETITWPIHFQYRACVDRPGLCSNPVAVVPVMDPMRGSLLSRGQKYRVVVDVEMPESPMNQKIGMFLVNMEMRSQSGEVLRQASRSGMLRYKSQLLHMMSTITFAPFLLYGLREEKQLVTIELFSQYEEDPVTPLAEVSVEVASRYVEVYEASLRIHATFSGLRYLMYHYPITATFMGVGICMAFLSAVVIFSWYQFADSSMFSTQAAVANRGHPNGHAILLQSVNTAEGSSLQEISGDGKPEEGVGKEEEAGSGEEVTTRSVDPPAEKESDDFEVVTSRNQVVVEEERGAEEVLRRAEGEVRHRRQHQ